MTDYYTSIMERRLAELFIYFQQSEAMYQKKINKLIQKLNNKMHSENGILV